ncbi:MAG: DUF262 domain-containing protein [Bacteroidales bacterium]
MRGDNKQLVRVMDGSENRFIIPVYQRNYDWKETHCKQLLKDLLDLINSSRNSHFFGSIVRAQLPGGKANDYLIIDGQQRLTTITLLLLAIHNNIVEGIVKPEEEKLAQKIWNKFIVDEYQTDCRKIRLKPIKEDCIAFDNILFKTPNDYIMSSNVTANYLFFDRKIKELAETIKIDDLYESITKLIVIDIFLENDDNPQLIFESLNSTGLNLSEADKIRNFILMGLEISIQEKYYELYWTKIERNTNYKVSPFIRDFLTLKTGKITTIDKVYFTFKEFVGDTNDKTTGETLKELLSYSEIFNSIIKTNTNSRNINTILKRINQLDISTIYPFLFALFNYSKETSLPEAELIKVLLTIEVFLFRRLICGLPTNALNKIFASLHKDIIRRKDETNNYSDILVYILQSKTGSSALPNDEEFIQSFSTKNIYSMQSKNKVYLFERFENNDSKETNDIATLMNNIQLSVEHIMPQTLSDSWKISLGDRYKEIYDKWLNTIANLTLTGYNNKYKNRPFEEKRDIPDGFKDSSLRLNKFLAGCDKWSENELTQRQSILLNEALKLWSYPDTIYQPVRTESETISLSEDFDYKGRTIKSFNFFETKYNVNDWADTFVSVVKLLTELDSSIIYKETTNVDNNIFSNIQRGSAHKKIIENVYLWTNNNTNTKINILKELLDKYELDHDTLEFSLVPIKVE